MKLWFEKGLTSLVAVASLTVGASSFAEPKGSGYTAIGASLLSSTAKIGTTAAVVVGVIAIMKRSGALGRESLPYVIEELRGDIEIYRATEELTVPLQAYLDHMRDEEAVSQEVSDLELIEFLDGEIRELEQKL